jgi:hypothetical protein
MSQKVEPPAAMAHRCSATLADRPDVHIVPPSDVLESVIPRSLAPCDPQSNKLLQGCQIDLRTQDPSSRYGLAVARYLSVSESCKIVKRSYFLSESRSLAAVFGNEPCGPFLVCNKEPF